MAEQFEHGAGADPLEAVVNEAIGVLLALAKGDFGARATRTNQGEPSDVLAFLVNSTAEEVQLLVEQLEEERRELHDTRQQLMLAAKLSALGELSASVAHELNQPLGAVQMLIELFRRKPDARVGEFVTELETISDAVRRMSRLVASVRDFTRSGALRKSLTVSSQPVSDALALFRQVAQRAGVELSFQCMPEPPPLQIDADRLNQVFVNLLSNAVEAVKELEPGHRRVQVSLDATAESVRISVEDSGPGIAPDLMGRLFEPFFTTKPKGQGTGLGLSISREIVSEHGGEIKCEPGKLGGLRFVVLLPNDQSAHPAEPKGGESSLGDAQTAEA